MKPETGSYDPSAMPPDSAQMLAAMGPFLAVIMLIALAAFVFVIFCYWKIFSKAGYSGALSLLLLVPLANFILLVWFAFADWPVLKGGGGGGVSKA